MNGRIRSCVGLLALLLPFSMGPGIQAVQAGAPLFNASAFGAGTALASNSPDGSSILYQKKTAHGWRIFVANRDGSGAKSVTSGPGDDIEASWRPDGALIAFASNRSGHWAIYLAHPNGSGLRVVSTGVLDARDPQWSPRPFELPYDKDPAAQTYAARKKSEVAPTDLQMLQKLSETNSEWVGYQDQFSSFKAARYYKLLFVQGSGAAQQIATIREDGRQLMTLSTGLKGPECEPRWDRTDSSIAFVIRHGIKSLVYTADYPLTHDLNDGEGQIKFGIDQGELRKSIKPVVVVDGTVEINWSPSGEYITVASGSRLRLIPRKGQALRSIALPTDPVAPYGVSWMNDGRSLLMTTLSTAGPRLSVVSCRSPLIDVDNLMDFDSLTTLDRSYLSKNAFVAGGAAEKQMFDVYERTDYNNLPIFITTDSLLHLHHLVFDSLLRDVESSHLTPDTITLVNHYLKVSLDQAQASKDPGLAAGATANAAFFAVAARLAIGDVKTGINEAEPVDPNDPLAADRAALRKKQDLKDTAQLTAWTAPLKQNLASLPPAVKSLSDQEIELISSHAGLAASPVFGGTITPINTGSPIENSELDYSDFIPRGHYTRSEVLRRYFLMSHWLRAGAFRRTPELTRRAMLIVSATDPQTMALWQKVENTTNQFVGIADDQDLTDYSALANDIYGSTPTLDELADPAKAAQVGDKVAALPQPKIGPEAQASFRFLPAPSTPDAVILQSLVYKGNPPDVGTDTVPRYFALGLDVMSVLGSDRAHTILSNTSFQGSFFDFKLKETQYANYDEVYEALRSQFAGWSEKDWSRTLYTRTLYALLPLLDNQHPAPYLFAKSPAWTDKNLNTALGTWAELKHDVIAKQPSAIESGGEGGITEAVVPVQPVGFVEPAPEVYHRLGLLVGAEWSTLAEEGYLTAGNQERLKTLFDLVSMVQSLQKKQISGQALTPKEVEQLRFYGAYQEHLTLITSPTGELGSAEGNDMAIVADVSNAYSRVLNQLLVLEEGVGRALPMYVAVPHNGHRQLACGAIFTDYEFTHPASDRLTDEKWRELLDSSSAPKLPGWTKSFVSEIDAGTGDN